MKNRKRLIDSSDTDEWELANDRNGIYLIK